MTIDGVHDLTSFNKTTEALTSAGLSGKDQSNIFKILASILHLGDISITLGKASTSFCSLNDWYNIEEELLSLNFRVSKINHQFKILVKPLNINLSPSFRFKPIRKELLYDKPWRSRYVYWNYFKGLLCKLIFAI